MSEANKDLETNNSELGKQLRIDFIENEDSLESKDKDRSILFELKGEEEINLLADSRGEKVNFKPMDIEEHSRVVKDRSRRTSV